MIGNSACAGKWDDMQGEQDAELMRWTLTQLGFESMHGADADYQQMEQAWREFQDTLQKHPRATAVVCLSGHGAQAPIPRDGGGFDVENFLIPTRSDLSRESDAPSQVHRTEPD